MRDREIQTVTFGDFRYLQYQRWMNGEDTGEKYWAVEELPRQDGKLNLTRWSDGFGKRTWHEDVYEPRRYPLHIEHTTWPNLAWAQLAAVAATTADPKDHGKYLQDIAYAAKLLDLPWPGENSEE